MTEEEEVKTPVIVQKKRKRVDGEVDEKKRKRRIFSLPLTPFMLFAGSVRENILRKNPTGSTVDLGRLIVAEWKKLSAEQRKTYEDISVSDKEAYSTRSDDVSEEKNKKRRSAYEHYDNIARKRFKQLNPNASDEKLKELSMLGWKNLPTSQKRSFQELARQENNEKSKKSNNNTVEQKRKTTIKIPLTKDLKSGLRKKKLNLKPLVVPNSNTVVPSKSNKTPPPPPPPFVMSPMGIRSTSPVPGGMMMLSPPAFPHLPFFPPGMSFPTPTPSKGGGKNGNVVTPPQTPQNMMAAAAAAAAMISPEFAMQMSNMNPMIGFPVSPNLQVPSPTMTTPSLPSLPSNNKDDGTNSSKKAN
jgi:hypothetical protein